MLGEVVKRRTAIKLTVYDHPGCPIDKKRICSQTQPIPFPQDQPAHSPKEVRQLVLGRESDHPGLLEAEPFPVADDDVVQQVDLQDLPDFHQSPRDPMISLRWAWVAGGMIVSNQNGVCIHGDRTSENFTRSHDRFVQGADADEAVPGDIVSGVQRHRDADFPVRDKPRHLGNDRVPVFRHARR